MIKKNSGKLFLVPLEFKLGFVIAKLMDFTDHSAFSGNVIYVYHKFFNTPPTTAEVNDISTSKMLFGPMCINKRPNERGKGNWKLLAQVDEKQMPPPIFQRTENSHQLLFAIDWSEVKDWKFYREFNHTSKEVYPYEHVRKYETSHLYDKRDVVIRATMHYIILSKKNVLDYYDLDEERLRFIYLPMVNTSFKQNEIQNLTKIVKPLKYD